MSYKAISHKGQSSDIFFTKNQPQPVPTSHRQNNKSSYDIIGLTDAPKENVTQHRKKIINANAMKSSVFSNAPETQQKVRKNKGERQP